MFASLKLCTEHLAQGNLSLGYPSSPLPYLRITLGLQHPLKMKGYYVQVQKTIPYSVAQTYLACGYVWE